VLLGSGAPCQLQTLKGQEHGRTIPLADIASCKRRLTALIDQQLQETGIIA
jgi:hypothetical protein